MYLEKEPLIGRDVFRAHDARTSSVRRHDRESFLTISTKHGNPYIKSAVAPFDSGSDDWGKFVSRVALLIAAEAASKSTPRDSNNLEAVKRNRTEAVGEKLASIAFHLFSERPKYFLAMSYLFLFAALTYFLYFVLNAKFFGVLSLSKLALSILMMMAGLVFHDIWRRLKGAR